MAKMAQADGEVSPEEIDFLAQVVTGEETVESLLQEAGQVTLAELVAGVGNYADKFFIAMRAAAMAKVDLDFDAREEAMLDRLLALLDLNAEDAELLDRTIQDMDNPTPAPPEPRIEELFGQSSFAA